MSWLEALILGILQGITEFLPVSSSGHIELGKVLLGIEAADNATLSVVLHLGTALSTVIVYWPTIRDVFSGLFQFQWNTQTKFAAAVVIGCIPAGLVGLFFKDVLDQLFARNMVLVGGSLLFTAVLLLLAERLPGKHRPLALLPALVIGLAQAVAILPGISRSGATVATARLLGLEKSESARFSFLMVLPLIFAANALEVKDLLEAPGDAPLLAPLPLAVGFLASLGVGVLACHWMIRLVQNNAFSPFAVYTAIVGSIALAYGLFVG